MRNRNLIRQPHYDVNDRPFMVIWETTIACDLACRHCRAEAIAHHDPLNLSFDEGCQLLDQIQSFEKPYPLVVLTGGDPFKREDIFNLVRYGTEIGLSMAVSPSATPTLTYANLERLKDAGAKAISLSLDGATASTHDTFRGVAGSFQRTLDGWQYAQEIGLKLQLNTTVTRQNLYDLPQVLELARQRGVMTWSVFFLVPTGRGLVEDEIAPQDYEDVMHWLYDASKYVRIKTTEGHHYKRVVLQRNIVEKYEVDHREIFELGETYERLSKDLATVIGTSDNEVMEPERVTRSPMHINAGKGFVFISRRGDVYPSGFMPVGTGNVREQALVDIYRTAPLFQSLRNVDELEGRCGACEFKAICGGSRSRAYAMTGHPQAEEPFCTYEPGSFPYQTDVADMLKI